MQKANQTQKKTENKPQEEQRVYIQVNNLPNDVTEEQINRVFGRYGKLTSARIKQYGEKNEKETAAFISYSSFAEAETAIKNTQCQLFGDRFIRVTFQDSEKPGDDCKVFIEKLDLTVTEFQLHNVFKDVALVYSIHIQTNKEGGSVGRATIKFYTKEDAEKACQELHNYSLRGKKISVLNKSEYDRVVEERKAKKQRANERANRGDDYHAQHSPKSSDQKPEASSKPKEASEKPKEASKNVKPVEEEKVNNSAPQASEKKPSAFGLNDLVFEKGSKRFDISASVASIKNKIEAFKTLSDGEKEDLLGRLVYQKLQDKGVKRNEYKITAMFVDLGNLRLDEVFSLIEDDKDFELRLKEAKSLLSSVWE